jgi:hypothetical protein
MKGGNREETESFLKTRERSSRCRKIRVMLNNVKAKPKMRRRIMILSDAGGQALLNPQNMSIKGLRKATEM